MHCIMKTEILNIINTFIHPNSSKGHSYYIRSHLHEQIIFRSRNTIFFFIFQATEIAKLISIATDDFRNVL